MTIKLLSIGLGFGAAAGWFATYDGGRAPSHVAGLVLHAGGSGLVVGMIAYALLNFFFGDDK